MKDVVGVLLLMLPGSAPGRTPELEQKRQPPEHEAQVVGQSAGAAYTNA